MITMRWLAQLTLGHNANILCGCKVFINVDNLWKSCLTYFLHQNAPFVIKW